jgi:hypothetical protein
MNNLMIAAMAVVAMTLLASNGIAQQAYVYPARGQSQEQQNRDQAECHGWAMQQTGYNPYQGSSPPPSGGSFAVRPAAPHWAPLAGLLEAMPARARRSELVPAPYSVASGSIVKPSSRR